PSPCTLTGSSLTRIERTRSAICGLSPGVTDATSRITVVPAGRYAPFSPRTGSFRVAVSLSPGKFDVQTGPFVVRPKLVPAAIPRDLGAGAGAASGAVSTGAGRSRVGSTRRG